MSGLAQDLRYALRQLRKSPGFSFTAIITLALGIGANTAIFSLLNAVMLQSIPVHHPEQLVILRWSAHSRPENLDTSSYGDCRWVPGAIQSCSVSYPIYKALAAHAGAFSSVLAMAGAGQLDLSGNGATSMVDGELVSGNYFETLGVSSALGRTIQPLDDRPDAPQVVVLGYGYWQRAFGGAADVVGRTVRLNSSPFTIAGVIDPQFTRLTPGKSHDLWIPLSHAASLEPASNNQRSRADDPNHELVLSAKSKFREREQAIDDIIAAAHSVVDQLGAARRADHEQGGRDTLQDQAVDIDGVNVVCMVQHLAS